MQKPVFGRLRDQRGRNMLISNVDQLCDIRATRGLDAALRTCGLQINLTELATALIARAESASGEARQRLIDALFGEPPATRPRVAGAPEIGVNVGLTFR